MKIIICVLLLIGVMFGTAEAYYSEPLSWSWNGKPVLCSWDNKYNEEFEFSINMWWNVLVEKYDESSGFEAYRVDGESDMLHRCNIHLVFVNVDTVDDTFILGRTMSPNNNQLFIFIYENNRPDDISSSIKRTVLHEIAHSFGVGHWFPESMGEGLKPWPTTLMWQYQEVGYPVEIDEYTMSQFRCVYGSDSWFGKNKPCSIIYSNLLQ
jgi:hypothetical protein